MLDGSRTALKQSREPGDEVDIVSYVNNCDRLSHFFLSFFSKRNSSVTLVMPGVRRPASKKRKSANRRIPSV